MVHPIFSVCSSDSEWLRLYTIFLQILPRRAGGFGLKLGSRAWILQPSDPRRNRRHTAAMWVTTPTRSKFVCIRFASQWRVPYLCQHLPPLLVMYWKPIFALSAESCLWYQMSRFACSTVALRSLMEYPWPSMWVLVLSWTCTSWCWPRIPASNCCSVMEFRARRCWPNVCRSVRMDCGKPNPCWLRVVAAALTSSEAKRMNRPWPSSSRKTRRGCFFECLNIWKLGVVEELGAQTTSKHHNTIVSRILFSVLDLQCHELPGGRRSSKPSRILGPRKLPLLLACRRLGSASCPWSGRLPPGPVIRRARTGTDDHHGPLPAPKLCAGQDQRGTLSGLETGRLPGLAVCKKHIMMNNNSKLPGPSKWPLWSLEVDLKRSLWSSWYSLIEYCTLPIVRYLCENFVISWLSWYPRSRNFHIHFPAQPGTPWRMAGLCGECRDLWELWIFGAPCGGCSPHRHSGCSHGQFRSEPWQFAGAKRWDRLRQVQALGAHWSWLLLARSLGLFVAECSLGLLATEQEAIWPGRIRVYRAAWWSGRCEDARKDSGAWKVLSPTAGNDHAVASACCSCRLHFVSNCRSSFSFWWGQAQCHRRHHRELRGICGRWRPRAFSFTLCHALPFKEKCGARDWWHLWQGAMDSSPRGNLSPPLWGAFQAASSLWSA